uniref:Uncharacterized protein n=1 Tax=Arundo donax TaxID=35708 RepID=A0A0A8ZIJ4_ARUDO
MYARQSHYHGRNPIPGIPLFFHSSVSLLLLLPKTHCPIPCYLQKPISTKCIHCQYFILMHVQAVHVCSILCIPLHYLTIERTRE